MNDAGAAENTDQADPVLIFVYNAESGLFNALSDLAHKTVSPATYQCSLCALTYSTFGMRKDWKQFILGLGRRCEFLHSDELKGRYGVSGVRLPAVFERRDGGLDQLIGPDEINACRSVESLMRLIRGKLAGR